MEFKNAKEDIQSILSFFSETFSRPSFKIFSSFVISFIQSGKEAILLYGPIPHVSLSSRSLSSFTRFLDKISGPWKRSQRSLCPSLPSFRIKTHSVLFLIVDDTVTQKTGKKMPGCAWHKEGAYKSHVFGHQWVLLLSSIRTFFCPSGLTSIT